MSIPFNKLALTHRGAIVSHGAEIDTDTIDGVRCCNVWLLYTRCIVAHSVAACGQFGVLIADGREGPFRFELEFIKALRYFDENSYAQVPKATQEDVLDKEVKADAVLNRRGQARV